MYRKTIEKHLLEKRPVYIWVRVKEWAGKKEGRYLISEICASVKKTHIFEKGEVCGRYVLGKGL